jgi:hypothetical protein
MKFSSRNKVVSDIIIAIRTEKRFTQSGEQSLFSLLLEMESRPRKMVRTNPLPPIGSRSISKRADEHRSATSFRYVE